jgi:hypothetical protein
LAAFTAYFDASGSEIGQPVLAVGGFLASAEAWLDFDREWLARLKTDGLDYFHTSEFNASRGQFKNGWKGDESRRRNLIADLVKIIVGNVGRKFGSVVVNDKFNAAISPEERKQWLLGSYSLAGRTCAARVRGWAKTEKLRSVPRLVFEEGDSGRGELSKILQQDGFAAPIFAPKKDTTDSVGTVVKAAVPLQAADLWAYEMFDPMRKIENDGYIKRIKTTYQELDRVPGSPGWYSVRDLSDLSSKLRERGLGKGA